MIPHLEEVGEEMTIVESIQVGAHVLPMTQLENRQTTARAMVSFHGHGHHPVGKFEDDTFMKVPTSQTWLITPQQAGAVINQLINALISLGGYEALRAHGIVCDHEHPDFGDEDLP